jgi:dTDP-4-amino-4,6-dideoxy-D-galactose acyltransferase
MKINKLEWDSQFFNLNVAEIFLEENQILIDYEDFDLIYVKSKSKLTTLPSTMTIGFEEERVEFIKEIKHLFTDNESSNIIFLRELDSFNKNDIYQLAFESGKHSRFKKDKRLNHRFHDLYSQWIEQTITKKFDNNLLVYVENNRIIGFITYKIDETAKNARVGLIAVDPKQQGKGIGKKLIIEAEKNCLKNNINHLIIPTQLDNIAACSFYKKIGYEIYEIINLKHLWKK